MYEKVGSISCGGGHTVLVTRSTSNTKYGKVFACGNNSYNEIKLNGRFWAPLTEIFGDGEFFSFSRDTAVCAGINGMCSFYGNIAYFKEGKKKYTHSFSDSKIITIKQVVGSEKRMWLCVTKTNNPSEPNSLYVVYFDDHLKMIIRKLRFNNKFSDNVLDVSISGINCVFITNAGLFYSGIDYCQIINGNYGWDLKTVLFYGLDKNENFIKVVYGRENMLFLTDKGQCYCCSVERFYGSMSSWINILDFANRKLAIENKGKGEMIVSIACGREHFIVVTNLGGVFHFGKYECLGYDRDENHYNCFTKTHFPKLPVNEKAMKVVCGNYCSLVVTNKGRVFGRGENTNGQLGFPVIRERQEEFTLVPNMKVVCYKLYNPLVLGGKLSKSRTKGKTVDCVVRTII